MSTIARILAALNALLSPANNAAARHDPDRDRALLVETLRSLMSKCLRQDVGAGD